MKRLSLAAALAAIALLAPGCAATRHATDTTTTGTSVAAASRLRGMYIPPRWLSNIIGREEKLFNEKSPGSLSIHQSKRADVVQLFGMFTLRLSACTTSYCPEPFRLHGTSLRLVISPKTHRIESARLSRRVDNLQALTIARRSNRYLRIFPALPGRAACRILRGGLQLRRSTFAGRCVTEYASATPQSRAAGALRILFGERWGRGGHAARAAWVVTVRYRDGTVLATQVTGQPPQLWK